MIKASWMASGVVIAGLIVFAACSSDDDDNKNAGASAKGQACQKTSDCAAGLACLPNGNNGGICVVGVFQLAPTGKVCVRSECQVAKDCCPQLDPSTSSNCALLKSECDEDVDAGFGTPTTGTCKTYSTLCNCDGSQFTCTNNKCGSGCKTDDDCASNNPSSPKCLGGTCGQCVADADCTSAGSGYTCVNAVCTPPCQTDGDCSGFDRCIAGKCQEGGCHTDRECVFAFQRADATCQTDGTCTVPCVSDTECGDPEDKYNLSKCSAGKCQYIGCQEDKDCWWAFNGSTSISSSSSSSSGSGETNTSSHIVCQFPPVPTAKP